MDGFEGEGAGDPSHGAEGQKEKGESDSESSSLAHYFGCSYPQFLIWIFSLNENV